jgi:uncharacterized protein (DUF983 family)
MNPPEQPVTPAAGRPMGVFGRLWAIARGRCGRCGEGRVFRGMFAMNENCPVCGLKFGREPGYFTGAMYFSYALQIVVIALLFPAVGVLAPAWTLDWKFLAAWGISLAFVPAVFRYSRVIWIHLDRSLDPS